MPTQEEENDHMIGAVVSLSSDQDDSALDEKRDPKIQYEVLK